MRLTVENADTRVVLQMPARQGEVSPIKGGMRFPLVFLDGATVRIDCPPGAEGVVAVVDWLKKAEERG